jgi:hypothetical protein
VVEESIDVLSSVKNLTVSKKKVIKQVKIPGPQASRFNVTVDKGVKMFKDGQRQDKFDKICKRRYTLLYVTAMGNVGLTIPETFDTQAVSPRLLQSLTPSTSTNTATSQQQAGPKQVMYLTVTSEYFASLAISGAKVGLLASFIIATTTFY